ncbi:MAG: SRPBCC family protein, partial [Elsteraceae bacterium]
MTPLFEIDRRFAAPPEKVFKAWTDPEDLKRWFAPAGMSMSRAKMDLRPGGGFHYALRAPTGFEMWGMWAFEEILAPEKLVLIQHFSDPEGGVTRHPLSPTWPLRTRSTTR